MGVLAFLGVFRQKFDFDFAKKLFWQNVLMSWLPHLSYLIKDYGGNCLFKVKISFLDRRSNQTLFPLANMFKHQQLLKTNAKPADIFVTVSHI